jgi:hypothetical protein
MNTSTLSRQQVIEVIDTLPDDAFSELVSFIGYLRYKSVEQKPEESKLNFLLSIAGIGSSIEKDVSDRDEEILASEINPIRGWSLRPDEQV